MGQHNDQYAPLVRGDPERGRVSLTLFLFHSWVVLEDPTLSDHCFITSVHYCGTSGSLHSSLKVLCVFIVLQGPFTNFEEPVKS